MMSATASAWGRSSFPAASARRVYSPGAARRAPAVVRDCRRVCWMYVEPCTDISTVSWPVYEWGAR